MLQDVWRVSTSEDKALVFYNTAPLSPLISLGRLSYDCYGSALRHPESDQHSIDKPAAATADPTAAEAASPRSVHNDMHSALPTRVTMVIKEIISNQ